MSERERKVVGAAATGKDGETLVVVCDDGAVFTLDRKDFDYQEPWKRLRDVPGTYADGGVHGDP